MPPLTFTVAVPVFPPQLSVVFDVLKVILHAGSFIVKQLVFAHPLKSVAVTQ